MQTKILGGHFCNAQGTPYAGAILVIDKDIRITLDSNGDVPTQYVTAGVHKVQVFCGDQSVFGPHYFDLIAPVCDLSTCCPVQEQK